MRRRVIALGMLASLATLVPPAFAETTSVSMLREAWYPISPTCIVPIGCGSAPTTTSYPEDTLHVGMVGGQETARTYVSLPPLRGARTGELVLPVADDAGTEAADIANLQVCLVPTGLSDPAPAEPPAVDCSVSSDASYLQGSPNYFTADLAPFLARGSAGLTLAVLPVPSAAPAAGEAWHVALSGRDRKAAGAAPIVAQLDLGSALAGPLPNVVPPQPAPAAGPIPAPLPPAAVPNMVAPALPAVVQPAVAPDAVPVAAPQELRRRALTIEGGTYGIVWALPLGLFLLGWAFVGTSRRDLRSYARAATGVT